MCAKMLRLRNEYLCTAVNEITYANGNLMNAVLSYWHNSDKSYLILFEKQAMLFC